ncbi:MAG: beta-hydroxyacyl-ACP dehydratase [Planctomycetes bacterium]|nr:beta-hydroxyacyl-ACP dehydratase [Planctomycetota bacterium]
MRWLWIDAILLHEPATRLVAVKNVSLAEEHLHQHFAEGADGPAQPLMPATLMLEGMAQTAGILVGSVRNFSEKVILAKVTEAVFEQDVVPGQSIRYDAMIERLDDMGASTKGVISRWDHRDGSWTDIGRTEIIFSHVDQNRAGLELPEHNFVFGENFRAILGGLLPRSTGQSPKR